jgi:hypothetical protein
MLADLRRLASGSPFVPFTIHMADGEKITVPTGDHIAVSPSGGRIVVFGDDDDVIHIFPLLITRLSLKEHPAGPSTD